MNKRTGLLLLILGIAVMIFALLDPTGMATQPDGGAEVAHGPFGNWPPLRMAILAAGGLVGVLGAYGLVKKPTEKK
jgi:hypothetical protein